MFVIISTERSFFCRKADVSLPFPAVNGIPIVLFHRTDNYVAVMLLVLKAYSYYKTIGSFSPAGIDKVFTLIFSITMMVTLRFLVIIFIYNIMKSCPSSTYEQLPCIKAPL